MRHLKLFEAISKEKDFELDSNEEIAKNLYLFIQDFILFPPGPGLTDGLTLGLLKSISIFKSILGDDLKDIKLEQIENIIDTYLYSASGKDIKEFLKCYDFIVDNCYLQYSREEVEDLFLDLDNYEIIKLANNRKVFFHVKVKIKYGYFGEFALHLWNVVNKRLPEELEINRVTSRRINERDMEVDIVISLK